MTDEQNGGGSVRITNAQIYSLLMEVNGRTTSVQQTVREVVLPRLRRHETMIQGKADADLVERHTSKIERVEMRVYAIVSGLVAAIFGAKGLGILLTIERRQAFRARVRAMLLEIPGALALSVLTAATTLLLALLLSATVGAASGERAAATRCYAAQTVNMVRDVMEAVPDLRPLVARYPAINTTGLDCDRYLTTPLEETP